MNRARDPDEVANLAVDRAKHGELLLAMNDSLNKLIEAQVGEAVGQMLSGRIHVGRVATHVVKDV